jgi:hypothetical protein
MNDAMTPYIGKVPKADLMYRPQIGRYIKRTSMGQFEQSVQTVPDTKISSLRVSML